jgi:hypothetical protein
VGPMPNFRRHHPCYATSAVVQRALVNCPGMNIRGAAYPLSQQGRRPAQD